MKADATISNGGTVSWVVKRGWPCLRLSKRLPLRAALVLAAGILLGSAVVGYAQTPITVTVGNASFEDPSVEISTTWHSLPAGGAWTDGNSGAIYELLNMALDSTHFNINAGAEGTGQWVLNLDNAAPMTQDLAYAVNAGDAITVSFYVGNSKDQGDPPVGPTVGITIDGVEEYSELSGNVASNGYFAATSVTWTATSGGNLGITFDGEGWMDAVGVEVTPALPTYTLTVNATTYGTPDPAVGAWAYASNTTVNASISRVVVLDNGVWYQCTGWTGTGSATSGSGTNTSFAITEDSSITWNWVALGKAWTPSDLTNFSASVAAWYDADDAGTLFSDTGGTLPATTSVARWNDKSVNGKYVQQGTPSWQPTTGAIIGGLNAVAFVRANLQRLLNTSFTISSANVSMAAVFESTTYLGNFASFGKSTDDNGTIRLGYGATNFYNFGHRYPDNFAVYTPVSAGAHMVTYKKNGTSSQLAYLDGTPGTEQTGACTTWTSDSLGIGAHQDGSEGHYDGSLGEVIYFSSAISDSDRQKIEGYLAWKWGLQGNLPATGHDYKNDPPVIPPSGTVFMIR